MDLQARLTNVINTDEAITLKTSLTLGELVHDEKTGYCYYKTDFGKYSFADNGEYAPCLGSQCPKRDLCFKYNEAKKFSEEDFLIRDLSIDKFETDSGWEVYCSAHNRYRHFRWN
jgi:hypothetical protein